MNKIKDLQKKYRLGKITKEEYEAAVAELLADEDITQDEHDEALDYDPEAGSGAKPIYTQEDMDRTVVKKARTMVRKALKEAGLEIPADVKPQDLLSHVAGLAAAGNGKQDATEKELVALRKKAAAYDALEPAHKSLVVENAVLKAAGEYNPVNPLQVVRAINADYKDLLEYDEETGVLDPTSVTAAIKRIAKVEPNLFQNPEGGTTDPEGGAGGNGAGAGFQGKPPGGAGAGGAGGEAGKQAAAKAKALEMMGIKPTN